jgi:hypothetical protein
MAWKAVARSATGTSHLKQQIPCQDYGDCKVLNDVIIGAVADGAGSAKYADIGAQNDSALGAVIDTDSFQVRDSQTGQVYRCTVGSEGFTPVELLGKVFLCH